MTSVKDHLPTLLEGDAVVVEELEEQEVAYGRTTTQRMSEEMEDDFSLPAPPALNEQTSRRFCEFTVLFFAEIWVIFCY